MATAEAAAGAHEARARVEAASEAARVEAREEANRGMRRREVELHEEMRSTAAEALRVSEGREAVARTEVRALSLTFHDLRRRLP